MALSSPGIGSNLDINSIIQGLLQIEQRPLTLLATREASFQAKLSAFGTIRGALSGFQNALKDLLDPAKLQVLKGSSSDATVATASAASTAVPGKFDLDISSIAQSQKLVAVGQTSDSAAIGSGVSTIINFEFGTISGGTLTPFDPQAGTGGTYSGATFTGNGDGVKSVTIDASNNTLAGIRDAINAADIGVDASIVNDGGTSPFRLVLASKETGVTSSMRISVSGDASIGALLDNDPAGTQNLKQTAAAQNTGLTVNGLFVSRPGTVLEDIVSGVTITALKTGQTSIQVSRDSSSGTNAINAFVKSFNDLNKNLRDLTAFNAASGTGAILQGDSTARTIQLQIRSALGSVLPAGATFRTLSEIGLSISKEGVLSLDSAKLQKAMTDTPEAVAALFAGDGSDSGNSGSINFTQGIAFRLDELVDDILGSGGTLASKTDGINRSIKDINVQREAVNRSLVNIEERLRRQFTALDTLISNLNQTSTFLTQQLANLPKING